MRVIFELFKSLIKIDRENLIVYDDDYFFKISDID